MGPAISQKWSRKSVFEQTHDVAHKKLRRGSLENDEFSVVPQPAEFTMRDCNHSKKKRVVLSLPNPYHTIDSVPKGSNYSKKRQEEQQQVVWPIKLENLLKPKKWNEKTVKEPL